ncbi:hypothetical protein D5S18_16625 [Nocardia panacis]|uniref:Uncharacterized protein n=1 Tax=Nocardia panacis TaxID=2340916 RepID=A0A3A4KGC3_9NOCA|nr:hypothetical protein [Nocardia panacis]RJO75018.1 hypothetical protein D5S18_16625 [Nocardia panacis]
MGVAVRRGLVRGCVVAALGLGFAVVGGHEAAAEACPDGTARVFLSNETNTCQGRGVASYSAPGLVSRVCSVGPVKVVVDITGSRYVARHVELENGRCAQFEYKGQSGATVQVSDSD